MSQKLRFDIYAYFEIFFNIHTIYRTIGFTLKKISFYDVRSKKILQYYLNLFLFSTMCLSLFQIFL